MNHPRPTPVAPLPLPLPGSLLRGARTVLGCLAVLGLGALAAQELAGARPAQEPTLTARMAERASAFLTALDADDRASATTGFDDPERRTWAFGPVRRDGLVLSALSGDEFRRLEAWLDTALSESGMQAWHQIRALESELRRRESTPEKPATHRDPDLYWLRVYGDPSTDAAWSWRFEGHHIALHVTCAPDRAPTVTPFFLGASPMFVASADPGTKRLVPSVAAFVELNDAVRDFLGGLSAADAAASTTDVARPADIRMGPGVDRLPDVLGLDARSLDADARASLTRVLSSYQSLLDPELRRHSLREGLMTDDLVGVHFVRWGSDLIGDERAWALRTPSFVLEFATTTGADHVHALLRDVDEDFGGPAR